MAHTISLFALTLAPATVQGDGNYFAVLQEEDADAPTPMDEEEPSTEGDARGVISQRENARLRQQRLHAKRRAEETDDAAALRKKKDADAHKRRREDEDVRQRENAAKAATNRRRREDADVRQRENAAAAEANRRRREDEDVRQRENAAAAEANRWRREDEDVRQRENEANRRRREDEDVRRQEREARNRRRAQPLGPFELPDGPPCKFCGAHRFAGESLTCCSNGNYVLPVQRLPPLPAELRELYQRRGVSAASRRLNCALSIAAVGTRNLGTRPDGSRIGGFENLPAPSNIRLHGSIYHRVFPVENPNAAPYYWVHDIDSITKHSGADGLSTSERSLAKELAHILGRTNPVMRSFRQLGEVLAGIPTRMRDLQIDIGYRSDSHELAALVSRGADNSDFRERLLFVVRVGDEAAQFVSEKSSAYEPLAYPLLYAEGTLGWHAPYTDINKHRVQINSTKGKKMTLMWNARQILLRSESHHLLGRLFNQWLVDMYVRNEDLDLQFMREKIQQRIRAYRQDVHAAAVAGQGGDVPGAQRIYLSSQFHGSPAHQRQLTHDGLCMAARGGEPSLFITMTVNPRDPAILRQLKPGQEPCDRPDVVCRVFKAQLHALLDDLRSGRVPGVPGIAWELVVVEFQKRGLPHAHILVRSKGRQPRDAQSIDAIISARVPSEEEDPELRELVLKWNIHHHMPGRCWPDDDAQHGDCKWNYPHLPNEVSCFDENGYARYQRGPEDAWVVPYSPYLTRRYRCHINVEVCAGSHAIGYLFKYLSKGLDYAMVSIVRANDQIDAYQRQRYVCATEAAHRLLGYDINMRQPTVYRLPVHLPGRDTVVLDMGPDGESDPAEAIQHAALRGMSDLEKYFNRPLGAEFDALRYIDFYERYILTDKTQGAMGCIDIGNRRVKDKYVHRRAKGNIFARMYNVLPSKGELFHLRVLLTHRPARSFDDLRRRGDGEEGGVYATFGETTRALGIVQDNNENDLCMQEAVANYAPPAALRSLFVTLITMAQTCGGPTPRELFDKYAFDMGKDYRFPNTFDQRERERRRQLYDQCQLAREARDELLRHLELLLERSGSSLEDQGLPPAGPGPTELSRERERYTDRARYATERDNNVKLFSAEQRRCYDAVVERFHRGRGGFIYIDGRSGRGKSLLMHTIAAALRAEESSPLVICTATTGVAAVDHEGGRTFHSLFKVPVMEGEVNTPISIGVKTASQRAELLGAMRVLFIDELCMLNRRALEASDCGLRSLTKRNEPFGGVLVIAAGDWRQTLPIVTGSRDPREVLAISIKSSPLWRHVEIYELTIPFRDAGDPAYSKWVDSVGMGAGVPAHATTGMVELPDGVRVFTDPSDAAKWAHEDFLKKNGQPITLEDARAASRCAVLAPVNERVDDINDYMLTQYVPGQLHVLHSADSVEETDAASISVDQMHAMNKPGVPPHALCLKEGVVVIILRNLAVDAGVVNGARALVTNVSRYLLTVKLLKTGQTWYLPRINFRVPVGHSKISILRRQFPVRVSFAMTINKSQGQTLEKVVIDLRTPVFSHGQLYVAAGRARNAKSTAFLLSAETVEEAEKEGRRPRVANVVYREALK